MFTWLMAFKDRSLDDFNEYVEHYRQLGSDVWRARCKFARAHQ